MQTILLIYLTDAWHTTSSKELYAVTDDFKKAIKLIRKNFKLTDDDFISLEDTNQTQGRETNILIEEAETNKVLINY